MENNFFVLKTIYGFPSIQSQSLFSISTLAVPVVCIDVNTCYRLIYLYGGM